MTRSVQKRLSNAYPYLLLLPALAILVTVLAYPWGLSLYISFHSYRVALGDILRFVGLGNFIDVLHDDLFMLATQNTILLTVGELILQFSLGLGIALALNAKLKFQRFFRTAALVPLMMAPALSALIWRFLVDPITGFFNGFLEIFGIQGPDWIGDPDLALFTILVIEVWKFTPYVILILLAGLQGIPIEMMEAAQIDGATRWQKFRYIVFPWLRPFVAIALLFRTMFVLRTFEIIYLLMGTGGPANSAMVYGVYVVFLTHKLWDLGLASAMSITLFMITAVVSLGYFRSLYR